MQAEPPERYAAHNRPITRSKEAGPNDMKKTQINPFDSKSDNRYKAFEKMRAEAPVHEVAGGRRFAVSQKAVEDGLKSVESFVGSFGNTGSAAEEDTVMAAIPEPRHGKIRKLFNSALGFHHVSRIEPFVRKYSDERLTESLELANRDGDVEIMESFARRIPSAIIAKVLGIPDDRTEGPSPANPRHCLSCIYSRPDKRPRKPHPSRRHTARRLCRSSLGKPPLVVA